MENKIEELLTKTLSSDGCIEEFLGLLRRQIDAQESLVYETGCIAGSLVNILDELKGVNKELQEFVRIGRELDVDLDKIAKNTKDIQSTLEAIQELV